MSTTLLPMSAKAARWMLIALSCAAAAGSIFLSVGALAFLKPDDVTAARALALILVPLAAIWGAFFGYMWIVPVMLFVTTVLIAWLVGALYAPWIAYALATLVSIPLATSYRKARHEHHEGGPPPWAA